MNADASRAATHVRPARLLAVLASVAIVVVMGAIALASPITIFQDNFADDLRGSNPNAPPVGLPWQITEVAPESISVVQDPLSPAANALLFGRYRNTALAPFSAFDRQQIATAGNLSVRFDYYGFPVKGVGQYFDVGALGDVGSDPAFLIRFVPMENVASSGSHEVRYLDPVRGLVDSGLDVFNDRKQAFSLTADFAAETFVLQIDQQSATLPMFSCPSEIVGVQFANYSVATGSGAITNIEISTSLPGKSAEPSSIVPEMATLSLLMAGGLAFIASQFLRRRAR